MANSLTPQQRQQLGQTLMLEIGCTEKMLTALQEEADALGKHEPELLEVATQVKLGRLRELEQIGKKREQLVASMPGIKQAQPPFSQDKLLNQGWNKLMRLAAECQQLNRVNGSVVERGYQQSRHALDILQGIMPGMANQNSVNHTQTGYDNSGHTTYSKRSRPIAQV